VKQEEVQSLKPEKVPQVALKVQKVQQKQEELIPLPRNFIESFKLSVEKSCRGRFRISPSLPTRMAMSYVRFLRDKRMLYGFDDMTGTFNVGAIFGAVAQIISTQGSEVKYAFPSLEKLCKLDIHLPVHLCSVLKTLGNFNCEYGRFEVDRPLSTVFHMLQFAYSFLPGNYNIKVFKDLTDRSYLIPWNSEGFRFFKDKAIEALQLYSRIIAGLKVLIPLPNPAQTKADYIKDISEWITAQPEIETLVNCIYLNEFKPPLEFERIGENEYRFITRDIFREISEWFNVSAIYYKEQAQSEVIKVFDCEKFVPTAEGNACQMVSRDPETGLVESRFLLPTADATLGAVFSYCEGIELIGDFAGIVTKDPIVEFSSAVQQGLERRYTYVNS
jgi:hypothetical protein